MGSQPPEIQVSSILFGDTMVLNIEKDYILLLGYSLLNKGCNRTGLNHQEITTQVATSASNKIAEHKSREAQRRVRACNAGSVLHKPQALSLTKIYCFVGSHYKPEYRLYREPARKLILVG